MADREEAPNTVIPVWNALSVIHEGVARFFRAEEERGANFMLRLEKHFKNCSLLDFSEKTLGAFVDSREALLDTENNGRANLGYTYGQPLSVEDRNASHLYKPSLMLPLVLGENSQHPLQQCSPFEVLAYAHHVTQAYKNVKELNKVMTQRAFAAQKQVLTLQERLADLEKDKEEHAVEVEAHLEGLHELFDRTETNTLPTIRRELERVRENNERLKREQQAKLRQEEDLNEDLRAYNKILEETVAQLRGQMEVLQAGQSTVQQVTTQLQKETRDVQKMKEELKREKEQLNAQKRGHNRAMDIKYKEVARLRRELDNIRRIVRPSGLSYAGSSTDMALPSSAAAAASLADRETEDLDEMILLQSIEESQRINANLIQQLEDMRTENQVLQARIATLRPETHNQETQTMHATNFATQNTQTELIEDRRSDVAAQTDIDETWDTAVRAESLTTDWIDEERAEKLERELREEREEHKRKNRDWIAEREALKQKLLQLETVVEEGQQREGAVESQEFRDEAWQEHVAKLTRAHDRIKDLQSEVQTLRTKTSQDVETLSRSFSANLQDLAQRTSRAQEMRPRTTDPEALTPHAMALVSMYSEKERSLRHQIEELNFTRSWTETMNQRMFADLSAENRRILSLVSRFFPPLIRVTSVQYPEIDGTYAFDQHGMGLSYVASITVGSRAGTQNSLSRSAPNVWHLQTNIHRQPNGEGQTNLFTLVASFNRVLPLGQVQAWNTQDEQERFEVWVHVVDPNSGVVYED